MVIPVKYIIMYIISRVKCAFNCHSGITAFGPTTIIKYIIIYLHPRSPIKPDISESPANTAVIGANIIMYAPSGCIINRGSCKHIGVITRYPDSPVNKILNGTVMYADIIAISSVYAYTPRVTAAR